MVRAIAVMTAGLLLITGAMAQKGPDSTPTGSISPPRTHGIFDVLNDAINPSLATYLTRYPLTNYAWRDARLEIGALLPIQGPVYRTIPREYAFAQHLRLTRINNVHLVVDPGRRVIVEVLR